MRELFVKSLFFCITKLFIKTSTCFNNFIFEVNVFFHCHFHLHIYPPDLHEIVGVPNTGQPSSSFPDLLRTSPNIAVLLNFFIWFYI